MSDLHLIPSKAMFDAQQVANEGECDSASSAHTPFSPPRMYHELHAFPSALLGKFGPQQMFLICVLSGLP